MKYLFACLLFFSSGQVILSQQALLNHGIDTEGINEYIREQRKPLELAGSQALIGQQVVVKNRIGAKRFAELMKEQGRRRANILRWRKKSTIGIDMSEVAFVNWNAGGSNSISGLAELVLIRELIDANFKWNNNFIGRYGINSQEGRELRKTDDQMEFRSDFGYRKDTLSNWYYSAKFSFQSQFSDGYKYPNTSSAISKFMSPGYVFMGVGTEYGQRMANFSLYASPATYKATFVLDQELADRGAFGVQKAVMDADGNIIKDGENVRSELGILVSSNYRAEVFENISINNSIRFYTDYLYDFGNVDVDWELNFNFKVNSFVLAKLGSHLKYDNDVKLTQTNTEGNEVALGARTQWKQQLGIGVILDF